MDLGECPRIHDLALRADFEAAQKLQDHFYDVRFQSSNWFMCSLTFHQVDACDHLASFVSDCDRKTEQAKKKLAETQEALSDEVRAGQNHCHHHHHHRYHHNIKDPHGCLGNRQGEQRARLRGTDWKETCRRRAVGRRGGCGGLHQVDGRGDLIIPLYNILE